VFDTVEIDSTFYAMPPPGRFRSWYERTPADFRSRRSCRATSRTTRGSSAWTQLFTSSATARAELEEKLGPLLIQLPPDMGAERPAVEAFVRGLPRELEFAIEFRDAAGSTSVRSTSCATTSRWP
jgi:uncharacterized protein YecE (DUF72 family)